MKFRRHQLIVWDFAIFIVSNFIVHSSPKNLFLAPHKACTRAQLPARQACSVPVPLRPPLPSGKETMAMREVNMSGMGRRSARLSTSKWLKYVEITSIDWPKTFRYVGSNLNYVGSNCMETKQMRRK